MCCWKYIFSIFLFFFFFLLIQLFIPPLLINLIDYLHSCNVCISLLIQPFWKEKKYFINLIVHVAGLFWFYHIWCCKNANIIKGTNQICKKKIAALSLLLTVFAADMWTHTHTHTDFRRLKTKPFVNMLGKRHENIFKFFWF